MQGKFTYPDGKTEEMTAKAGQTIRTPAVKHQPENTGDKPFEVIQVEMKSRAEDMKDTEMDKVSEAQDAARLDSKHYTVEFENDRVRILRISYGSGEKSVMHAHPEGVAVFLSDVQGKFAFPDGKTEDMSAKAGQAIWLPALQHQPENSGGPLRAHPDRDEEIRPTGMNGSPYVYESRHYRRGSMLPVSSLLFIATSIEHISIEKCPGLMKGFDIVA